MGIKLFFLDMEGTIFAKQYVPLPGDPLHHHSLWSRLMYECGPAALVEDAKTMRKWERGEYGSYLDWAADSVAILRRHGLTRDQFQAVIDSIDYNQGVVETIHELHRRAIRTAIVSGGFFGQARRAQVELGIPHCYAAVDLYWSEQGEIVHCNILPSDYRGKVDFVRLMLRECGCLSHECAFVGDGQNDVLIAREVGLSFACDAHPDLQREATHTIVNFSELLGYLAD